MFLAAGPYFQGRFQSNESILNTFQAAELSVSTVMNLGSMLVLTNLQANASYPKRIGSSLVINVVVFTLLAISTRFFIHVSAGVYFGFLLVMVAATSLATGLMQNGLFAYVSGFGQEKYTQGIMTGQGIAGVLPCIAQIVTVLSVPETKAEDEVPEESRKSAFAYFLTATAVSAASLLALLALLARQRVKRRIKRLDDADELEDNQESERKKVPLLVLLQKLIWPASAIFLTFLVTMSFPVLTQQIHSVRDPDTAPRIFQPSSFIPLAFLLWNTGDLVGRVLVAVPSLSLISRPRILFLLSVCRIVWIPMFYLCNIRGRGAVISSDAFYLVIVQFLFGLSNGYIGSSCMMGAVEWVDADQREAAGGFMGLSLVAGLAVGSFVSFAFSGR